MQASIQFVIEVMNILPLSSSRPGHKRMFHQGPSSTREVPALDTRIHALEI